VLLRRYEKKKMCLFKEIQYVNGIFMISYKVAFLRENPIFFTAHFIKVSIKTEPLGIF